MTIDIKNYFLQWFLEEPEYLRIHNKYFFPEIRDKYKIDELMAEEKYVYYKLRRGLYGLKQAACLT